MIAFKCDICGCSLTREEEFHGNCPQCGAGAEERHITRSIRINID